MIFLGWTRDQVVEQIDVPFLEKLNEAWSDCPPLAMMVAGYLGIKPKQKSKNIHELLGLFPGGVIK